MPTVGVDLMICSPSLDCVLCATQTNPSIDYLTKESPDIGDKKVMKQNMSLLESLDQLKK